MTGEGFALEFVSTHAPTGGATLCTGLFYLGRMCFNPRAHGRRDFGTSVHPAPDVAVSTHAPTGGATDESGVGIYSTFVSTHAPTGGATLYHRQNLYLALFQPTRPREARLQYLFQV